MAPRSFLNHYDRWQLNKEFQGVNQAALDMLRPLHMLLGGIRFVINLSCKIFLDKSKSQVRGDDAKQLFAERHNLIKERFKEQMNMRVDVPLPGGGTTTNGNIAREAFSKPEELAKLLDLNAEFVSILALLLLVLRCFCAINIEEFERLCKRAKEIYLSEFPNLPLTPNIHQLLDHGAAHLRALLLPPGFYSEEGSESNNKFFRKDRTAHARLDTREHNIEDIHHHSLIRSDPKISKVGILDRQLKKKKVQVTPALQRLLLRPAREIEVIDIDDIIFDIASE